ncbi:FRIGIDA-like protein 4a isoform X2 [Daucus carota subsp. sativus]|uniref:FRIGIDA-like protein 4a isoform X2 n=1 Tax=Daucus carota subsp. sativus TaxID=79200 RepID=UPI0007EFB52A|nr:PREDICTED: FRIGIDA-like protein 4a isoform X2 [Daucus carota subsp. sativus]
MATDYIINPDKIQTFFTQIEEHKNLLTSITDFHKTLATHFTSLSETLAQKSQNLDAQIESFHTQSKKSLELLENRENSIPEREASLVARINEQKGVSISDIESDNVGRNLGELLRMYFRRMDGSGLVKFLLAKRKESVVLRTELGSAVEEAVDVFALVLDVVEEFVGLKSEGGVGMADRRWACGLLVQVVVPLEEGKVGEVMVGSSLKERAMMVLEKWKGMLGGGGESGVGAGEATMFLQIVYGFGLKDRFEEKFLRSMVLEFAGRRDMAKIAAAVGFTDIIDELVKSGKEVEAVYFATEFDLTEKYAPVSLLKSHLKNIRKNANSISKNGKYSAAAVDEANNSEMIATKAIIKCVEDHKLESQFPTDNLKKRITQLEKAKAEKKKSASSVSKPSNKRAHGGSSKGGGGVGTSSRPPKAGRISTTSPSFRQRNPSQIHQTPGATRYAAPYSYPNPSLYDVPGTPSYVSAYGGPRIKSPVGLQHAYAAPDVGVAGIRAGTSYAGQGSYGVQSNYAAYDYPPASAYPPTYPQ